jgi:(p)ppGpp synthase/HD superfamily hydrolase
MKLSIPARALIFALHAHEGQKRKYTGEPYIVHPIAVADLVASVVDDEEVIAAAYLHDVIEDTHGSEEAARQALLDSFGNRITHLVDELTDVFTKERYPKLNRAERKARERDRLATVSREAKTIKLADVICNSYDIARQNAGFAKFDLAEKEAFLEVVGDGNAELYRLALRNDEEARQLIGMRQPGAG